MRVTSKPPLPPEANLVWSRRTHQTENGTSRVSGTSYELPEPPIMASTEPPVTPTISGTSVTQEEVTQLLEATIMETSEQVTEVDTQLEVNQPEITSKLEPV